MLIKHAPDQLTDTPAADRNGQHMTRVVASLTCAALCTGCLTSDVRLLVRPDGSGTITYALKVSPSQLAEMEKLFPVAGGRPRPPVEALFQGDAGMWMFTGTAGSEVRPLSSKPLKSLDSVGRELQFEFDDVSKVQPELLPSLPGGLGAFYMIASADPGIRARLGLSLGTTPEGDRRLTIRFPKFAMDPNAEPPGASVTGTPAELSQLRKALKGTRLTIAVETATPLIRTNSPHRDGNRVTLLDIDVETALFSRQIDMLRATPASFDEYLSMLGDLPGVTLASDHVITMDFQAPAAGAVPCGGTPPATEIFLAPLEKRGDAIALGPPVDISNSPGYDNQPSFTPDGRSILFTSARATGAGATPLTTDIYRYDVASRQTTRVTNTPECEYSPAMTPDGKRISVVRVEADATQRLWTFSLDGAEPALVLSGIKPVGYYTWIDQGRLALYVLGQPATLQVADVRTGKAEVVAQDVGRSIQRVAPNEVAFVQRAPAGAGTPELTIMRATIAARSSPVAPRVAPIVPALPGSTEPYPVWLPDGTVLMAHDRTLYRWRPGEAGWSAVVDLSAFGLSGVTRLAVSPQGDRLALVAPGK
jgi:hypothetical protein